jgi:hypothetical protein
MLAFGIGVSLITSAGTNPDTLRYRDNSTYKFQFTTFLKLESH